MKNGYYKIRGLRKANVIFWIEELPDNYTNHAIVYRVVLESNSFTYFKENEKDTVTKYWIEDNCELITNSKEIKRLNKRRVLLGV